MLFAAGQVRGPDYAMIIGYFLLMLGIGVFFYRQMRGMKMYFTGNNRIPWWLSGVSFYMTSFSAYAFVTLSDFIYRDGFYGLTMAWVAVPAAVFSVTLFATRWRRARIDSPLEYLESRYSRVVRQVFVWEGILVTLLDDALKLVCTGAVLSAGIGVPMRDSIIWSSIIMLSYTFMGGLWAVTVTDFVQFIVLLSAVLILLPLSFDRAGGLTAVFTNAPDGFFNLTTATRGWTGVILVVLLYCVTWSSTRWSLIQKYYCVPTEKDSRKVGWLVAALCLVGPPLMYLPAMAWRVYMPGIPKTEHVYPLLCCELLPMGLLGLLIAAMFSATMSTLSGDLNVCASVLTNDVYRRFVRPGASERELVNVGRIMTLATGAFAVGAAVLMANSTAKDLFDYMLALFSVATPPIGIPMLLGLLSKRVTNRGALAGLVIGILPGLAMFFLLPRTLVVLGIPLEKDNLIFVAGMLTTLVVTYGVSYLAPMTAEEAERVKGLQQRLRTPIGQLPQDVQAVEGKAIVSPFRVVGVCTVLIGLLMLGVQPWVEGALATRLNVGFGVGLVLLGALMFWASRPRERATA